MFFLSSQNHRNSKSENTGKRITQVLNWIKQFFVQESRTEMQERKKERKLNAYISFRY